MKSVKHAKIFTEYCIYWNQIQVNMEILLKLFKVDFFRMIFFLRFIIQWSNKKCQYEKSHIHPGHNGAGIR